MGLLQPLTMTELQNLAGGRQKPVESHHASGIAAIPPLETLQSLYKVCPDAAFFTSISPVCEVQEDSGEPVLPNVIATLIDESKEFSVSELWEKWTGYSVSSESCALLEQQTRSQSDCPLWFQHRRGRITGSKAHDVLVLRPDTDTQCLVQNVMGYLTYNLSKKKEVKWGIENEDKARSKYFQEQSPYHRGLEVRTAGFIIDSECPYLGASPDGICRCDCCGTGCVEIKCPFSAKDCTIAEAVADKRFCLDKNLNLKHSHRYYTQVQFQMMVARVDYCDFVVFTNKEIAVIRIQKDINFLSSLTQKCDAFFKQYLLPEIVMRKLKKAITDDGLEPAKELVCLCREPSYGKMIVCQGNNCEHVKFHYGCVNIRRKPRKLWLCPKCVEADL